VSIEQTIHSDIWTKLRFVHTEIIAPFTTSYRERKGKGLSHPIYDFLFTYYTFSPAKLEKWHPGYGVALEFVEEIQVKEFLENPLYNIQKSSITLSLEKLRERELKQLIWIRSLCQSIRERAPRFSCLGLHEWAMVYKSEEIRHAYPLRLSGKEIEDLLESSQVVCSHFDAFRFFTPKATKLNILNPTPDTRIQNEQGGCLHANMDLYKWAFKLLPWVSSELLRECFLLAIKTREIDMKASPYDFSKLGFEPIKIETENGKEEYREAQKLIALEASVLRDKLILSIENVLKDIPSQKILSATEMLPV
jgi:hypothetical protein